MRSIFTTALVALALALSSCSKMPKDWPLVTFKPPKGATIMAIPRKIDNLRERMAMLPEPPDVATRPDWQVAFDFPAGWDALSADADAKLKELGYTEWQPQRLKENDAQIGSLIGIQTLKDAVHVYTAPDKTYTVVVLNAQSATSQENAIEHEGAFIYQITKGAK
jgi:hypothetical protein